MNDRYIKRHIAPIKRNSTHREQYILRQVYYITIRLICQPYNYNNVAAFVVKYSYKTNSRRVKMNVAKRLISLRERCGYTQNGLAERAGVSQTHLRRVELGQADITVGHLQLLCDAMGISLRDFFGEETETDEVSIAMTKLSPKQKALLLSFLESL